jgi:hypothetical protein
MITFPCLLIRIKFFGSFYHLVADASEWEAITQNIPPLMTIIICKGRSSTYLNQDKYGSTVISYPQNFPEKQYFKQLLVACFCNTLYSVGFNTNPRAKCHRFIRHLSKFSVPCKYNCDCKHKHSDVLTESCFSHLTIVSTNHLLTYQVTIFWQVGCPSC